MSKLQYKLVLEDDSTVTVHEDTPIRYRLGDGGKFYFLLVSEITGEHLIDLQAFVNGEWAFVSYVEKLPTDLVLDFHVKVTIHNCPAKEVKKYSASWLNGVLERGTCGEIYFYAKKINP